MLERTRLAGLVACLALCLCAFAPSPCGGVTEKEFEQALVLVDRTLAVGKAKKAKELLLATLAAHEGEPWAIYRLTEVKDTLRRCTFWSANEKPDPKQHLSGELVSYSPASGQIKLRYTPVVPKGPAKKALGLPPKDSDGDAKPPRELADFLPGGNFLVHPLMFDGPSTIELEGSAYPTFGGSESGPVVMVCAGFGEAYLVMLGLPEVDLGDKVKWLPARILRVSGGGTTIEDEAKTPNVAGKPFEIKVVVGGGTISAFLNGSPLLNAKKSPSTWGQFGIALFPSLEKLTINGKTTPTWIQGVVDAATQKRWDEFETKYAPEDDLPAALRARAGPPVPAEPGLDEVFPGEDGPKRSALVKAVTDHLKGEKPEKAIDYIAKIPAADSTPVLRAWLSAIACRRLGRIEAASAACDEVAGLDPRFLPARRMRVDLELEQTTKARAIERCRAVIADFAGEAGPRGDLVELLLLDGRPEEARAELRRAIDDGVPPGALEESDHLLAHATKGPLWGRAFEYTSEHYVVSSDISQQMCFQAADALEKFYAKFNIHLRRVAGKDKHRFRVHLFSGEAGYLAYTEDLTGAEQRNTAGLYSPVIKQLVIWNLPDTDKMLETVRHEGFHQYFDRLVGASPVWLNEGLAEYYEGSRLVGGKWSDGEPNLRHLATLREKGLFTLESFLAVGSGGFYHPTQVELSYAQAWAFVHFLLNGGSGPRRRFEALLDALVGGAKPRDAIRAALPDADLPALQKEFRAYVETLR